MTFLQVKEQLGNIFLKWSTLGNELDDFKFGELYESEAEDLIASYCEFLGYQINGFPTDKRNQSGSAFNDEYFCRERFRLYIDMLAVQRNDVAELLWYFQSTFWPEFEESKEDLLKRLKEQIERGDFYEVSL